MPKSGAVQSSFFGWTREFSYIIMIPDITYFKGMRLEDTDEKR